MFLDLVSKLGRKKLLKHGPNKHQELTGEFVFILKGRQKKVQGRVHLTGSRMLICQHNNYFKTCLGQYIGIHSSAESSPLSRSSINASLSRRQLRSAIVHDQASCLTRSPIAIAAGGTPTVKKEVKPHAFLDRRKCVRAKKMNLFI
ncbi:hypothetical protein L6164_005920 [Bauhinia variegata]|uniref:Uncharacterized protein n=1 Tax=Bauhinia variegata TaxID=167791 RepID=A0ACB9PRY2_BAUVA|nr:hypothetical protein L6164_005920 [Bauhinia variegata]